MAAENVMEVVSQLGAGVTDSLAYLGALATLGSRAAYYTFIGPFQGKSLRVQSAASQAMEVGVRALPILSLITFFIGLILALQSAYELSKLGAMNLVAKAVALSMSRELGPLITAIVVIGRSGSAFAAEIGTMKVTEEIDALEVMAINPVRFPRRAEISGHDGDAALPDDLGEYDGHSRRGAIRSHSGGFHLWPIHSSVHRVALHSRYPFGSDQERDVWRHDHGCGVSRRFVHGRGRGASGPLHDTELW